MLSLALARTLSRRESGRRAAALSAAKATTPTPSKARSIIATRRQRAACTASSTNNVTTNTKTVHAAAACHNLQQQHEEASSRRRISTSLLRATAAEGEGISWTEQQDMGTPRWAGMAAAARRPGVGVGNGLLSGNSSRCVGDAGGYSGGYSGGFSGGGYNSSHSSSNSRRGWRNRRPLCGVATAGRTLSPGSDGRSECEKGKAGAGAGAGAGSRFGEGQGGATSTTTSADGSEAFGGGSNDGGSEQREEARQQQQQQKKKRRPAVRNKKRSFPFGKPLSLLVPPSGGGGNGVEVEDALPDPDLVAVEGAGGNERGTTDTDGDRKRATAARPEVVHALSRGLADGRARDVALNLSQYALSERSTKKTLAQMERRLARKPHQTDWVMPLIRAHLTEEEKPSSKTHREHLTYVRDVNAKGISHEDMAESLLRAHRRHSWGPDMTGKKLKTEHPERWEEAMLLSAQIADRLPVCTYQRVWKTLQNYLEAEKTPRRMRVMRHLFSALSDKTHLVLPAIARFWRLEDFGGHLKLQAEIDRTRKKYHEDRALLARCLLLARRKSLPKVEELNEPLSIEEQIELHEARARRLERERLGLNPDEDEDEDDDDFLSDRDNIEDVDDEDPDDGGDSDEDYGDDMDMLFERGGGLEKNSPTQSRKNLEAAASKLISRAQSPKIPERAPAVPLGLFELFVVETPRELNMPPPPDIFGDDTPAGFGTAGMSELPKLGAGGAKARAGMRPGEEYAWPEEKAEEEGGQERGWWEGAGEKQLSPARAKDYKEVEDVLLTGNRRKRPPDIKWSDIEDDLAAIARKMQLLKRSALVAELHPDEKRLIELQLQEEGSRTAFVGDLPSGLNPRAVKEAFFRCGPVHQVIIREPTFRAGNDDSPEAPSNGKARRSFALKPPGLFAFSSPHGLVVFKDHEGFKRATAESFRIFGVHIEGTTVTTRPAQQCRTVFVENIPMRTGLGLVEAINKVLKPHYTVGLKTHLVEDDTPQVVAIPLASYAAARSVDTLLTKAGFLTTFHYIIPKGGDGKSDETGDSASSMASVNRRPDQSIYDEVMAMSEEGLLLGALDALKEGEEEAEENRRLDDEHETYRGGSRS